ncbi:MAG: RNA methyltransferase [Patescibacteria group bacterium]|nr:RNA methyltransferase [Patescibacteria group bacterium]
MKLTVILHNIRSVHNVGSIFRTADGVRAEKIYLCGITPTPLGRFGNIRPDLAKVALGAERSVPWEYAKSTMAAVKKLKKEGYRIFALEQAAGSVDIGSSALRIPLSGSCLILGDEIRGLPPSILKLADRILEIPMRGRKESLNVSVAFGIAAYAFLKKDEQAKNGKGH